MGYANPGRGEFDHSDGSSGDLDLKALTVALRVNLLQGEKFTPYLKLGASRLKNRETWSDSTPSDSAIKNNLYWSLGGEYALNRNYLLTIDYDDYGKSGAFNRPAWTNQPAGVKARTLSFGIRYKFD